ncbi:hypothetical protein DFP73DRAFT_588811 [Morchella snyderi]|nr:hypothetical protein DFP73DRAFT_588811 [Morchella snyderi]
MTLGSETAALLVLATHALSFQTSAGQHALLTPEERKSALRQLMVTVETAGELAKVAHVEPLAKHNGIDGDIECKRADPEWLRAEAESFGREAAREALGTKGVRMVGGAGAKGTQTVYGRLAEDTERIYAMLERFGNNVDKAMQEMEALNEELEKVKREKLEAEGEARKSVAEMEKLRQEMNRVNNHFSFRPL